jgi:hypothetical protein
LDEGLCLAAVPRDRLHGAGVVEDFILSLPVGNQAFDCFVEVGGGEVKQPEQAAEASVSVGEEE